MNSLGREGFMWETSPALFACLFPPPQELHWAWGLSPDKMNDGWETEVEWCVRRPDSFWWGPESLWPLRLKPQPTNWFVVFLLLLFSDSLDFLEMLHFISIFCSFLHLEALSSQGLCSVNVYSCFPFQLYLSLRDNHCHRGKRDSARVTQLDCANMFLSCK